MAEFHKIRLRDIFVVNTNLEGCEIEICFFIARSQKAEDKTQMLFTNNYFNPVATENLVLKLATEEENHKFIELVGFMGKLSDDHYTRVERAVDLGFEIFIKRVEEMARNLRHVEDIDSFVSVPTEPLKRKSGPIPVTKHASGRWGFSLRAKSPVTKYASERDSRAKSSVVDLTSEEEKEDAAYRLTDEVSTFSLFEYACSDVQGEPLLDDPFDEESGCLEEGWDQQVSRQLFERAPLSQEYFDTWILELADYEHHKYFEDGFLELVNSSRTPSPAKPRMVSEDEESQSTVPASTEVPKTSDISVIDYYYQKASGSSSNQRKTIPITKPQLGRGLDQSESVEFDVKPRKIKSNLLSDSEIEKYETSKKAAVIKSTVSSFFAKTSELSQGYKIPKLQKPSQEQSRPSSSILSQSPYAVNQRRPIHANTQSPFLDDKKSIFKNRRMVMSRIKFPEPSTSPVSSAYTGASEIPKFSSKNPAGDDDDVIVVDDETENDQNNNQRSKRRLFVIEPEPSKKENKSYKIFKSKQKPQFERYDGTQE